MSSDLQSSPSTIYIMGKGAVGSLLTAQLSSTYPVTLILRNQNNSDRSWSFSFTDLQQQETQLTVPAISSEHVSHITCLIIPLKAYDIERAFLSVKDKLSPDCSIILSHNGLGTAELILPHLQPTQQLFLASTTHGAFKSADNQVVHSGKGVTWLGLLNDCSGHSSSNSTFIQSLLNNAIPPVTIHQDILALSWKKLAINCLINPLTAIHQIRNGELLQQKYHKHLNKLALEFSEVANAAGFPMTAEEVLDSAKNVMINTAKNWSSMNRDVANRKRTEVTFITGFICEKALHYQINVPTHQNLLEQILQLEVQYLNP